MPKFVQEVLAARKNATAMLLSDLNDAGKLLNGADEALVGVCHQSGRVVQALYDKTLLTSMGLKSEDFERLTDVSFIEQSYMSLDLLYIASLALHTAGSERSVADVPMREQMENAERVATEFLALVEFCAANKVDLPTAVAHKIAQKAADNNEQ